MENNCINVISGLPELVRFDTVMVRGDFRPLLPSVMWSDRCWVFAINRIVDWVDGLDVCSFWVNVCA